jgi:hypothetical protein
MPKQDAPSIRRSLDSPHLHVVSDNKPWLLKNSRFQKSGRPASGFLSFHLGPAASIGRTFISCYFLYFLRHSSTQLIFRRKHTKRRLEETVFRRIEGFV